MALTVTLEFSEAEFAKLTDRAKWQSIQNREMFPPTPEAYIGWLVREDATKIQAEIIRRRS